MHHASSLLQSIQVLGQFAFQDKIDVEHPEIHAALTAGLVAVDKCRQELPPLLEVAKEHQAACWLAPL